MRCPLGMVSFNYYQTSCLDDRAGILVSQSSTLFGFDRLPSPGHHRHRTGGADQPPIDDVLPFAQRLERRQQAGGGLQHGVVTENTQPTMDPNGATPVVALRRLQARFDGFKPQAW